VYYVGHYTISFQNARSLLHKIRDGPPASGFIQLRGLQLSNDKPNIGPTAWTDRVERPNQRKTNKIFDNRNVMFL
jgi:hypothetical protein